MLMSAAAGIAPAITDLLNISINLVKVPSGWKIACLTPTPVF